MALYDLSPPELERHRCSAPEPAGLDAFWQHTLDESRSLARPPLFAPYRPETYGALAVDDVTFSGFGGDPIRAWFLRPRAADGPARHVSSPTSATAAAAPFRSTTRCMPRRDTPCSSWIRAARAASGFRARPATRAPEHRGPSIRA